MVRLSLQRHVPVLVATGALVIGCGPRVLGFDTDGTDSDPTDTEPTTNDPSNPSGNPTSDPTVDPTVDPTTPTDPTIDPTGTIPLPGPPLLVDAVVRDAFTIELFFSEPIATIADVDPRKFRISFAFSNSYYSYGSTMYGDLGRWNGDEVCHEYCYGGEYGDTDDNCYEWCYTPSGPNVNVQSIVNGNYTDRAILALDGAMTPNLCAQLRKRVEEQGADQAALFLHYSNNGPGITDQDGESLDAIAEHWVLTTNTYSYQQGEFPFMNPFIPIDCPF